MGTRGMIGFIKPDGTVVGSYNHFDSYPSHLGANIQAFISEWFLKDNRTFEQMAASVGTIRWVDQSAEPTEAEKEEFKDLWEQVDTGKNWYAYLRAAQGNMRFMLEKGIALGGGANFLKDSLFCEYAYLVDLRDNTFIVMEGFNKDRSKEADFCKADPDEEYAGCKIAFQGNLTEFLAIDMQTFLEDDD